ncbi:hypothetical protein [Streptomyces sp. NPDC057052]|uniref:hypothetical protein n=1 Tax=Streptomyces sp. NPDC057052 TaxID=3346010 RepID=UPI003638021F
MIHHRAATLMLALSALMLSACAPDSPARPASGRQLVRPGPVELRHLPRSADERPEPWYGPERGM